MSTFKKDGHILRHYIIYVYIHYIISKCFTALLESFERFWNISNTTLHCNTFINFNGVPFTKRCAGSN